MPVYRFEGPDGRVHRVEADTPEDAQAGLEQTFAPKPRTSEALGFVKGVMKPLDNAAMALENLVDRIPGVDTGAVNRTLGMSSAAQATDAHAAAIRAQGAKGVVPGRLGEFVGNVVGTLPIAAVTKNPWALGGVSGAALTDSRDVGGVALDAAIGAVGGKVMDKAVRGAAQFVKPRLAPAVQVMKDAGVRLTPGQSAGGRAMVREDKLMSRPFVGDAIANDRQAGLGDFVVGAANRALKPLGVTVPKNLTPGHDVIGFADDAVKAAYNKVVPQLKLSADPKKLVAKAGSVPRAYQGEFNRIVSEHLGNGNLTGRALKNAEGEIKRLASSYARSQVAGERELGFALGRVHDRLTAAMVAQNPVAAPALKAANRAFRGVATIQDAAGRADGGMFTTGQLKQAVRRADSSARKGASARGGAFMQDFSDAARQTLPSKYPDSGTAGRMGGGLFGGARGLVDLGAYRGRQGYQALLDAPRPAAADPIAQLLLNNRGPLGLFGPAALSQGR